MRITPRSLAVLLVALSCTTIGLAAQGTGKINTAPITVTNPSSPDEMFGAYCAVCHGKGGKGNGPVASELKTLPPDLTTLTKRHDGKYPSNYVLEVLRNGPSTAKAHGSAEMPVWGPLFNAIGNQGLATQRIANLNKYIESMQAK
jgi:mono/diheme cytochrome c family protein